MIIMIIIIIIMIIIVIIIIIIVIIMIMILIILLFTINSIYSTNACGAEQMGRGMPGHYPPTPTLLQLSKFLRGLLCK